jgi:hypothetical protein
VSASSLDQNNCRSGYVLKGAENKKELKILSECKSARGIVHDVHKHMKDGDYNIMISFSSIMGGSSEVDVLKKHLGRNCPNLLWRNIRKYCNP